MKPLIAVTVRLTDIKGLPSVYVNQSYVNALQEAGAFSILLNPEPDEAYYQEQAARCDGLLLSGGKDMAPSLYGEEPHPLTVTEDRRIDQTDLLAIRAFHAAGKPILGICRGAQAVNVCFGGTLYQHLPDEQSFFCAHKQTSDRTKGSHTVIWQQDTPDLWSTGSRLFVNSLHHQGIRLPAPGFSVAALSEDGLIEAIQKDRLLAVQWHPEEMTDDAEQRKLFHHFIRACQTDDSPCVFPGSIV